VQQPERWKSKLWSPQGRAKLDKLALAFWAGWHRRELWELLDRLNPRDVPLREVVPASVWQCPAPAGSSLVHEQNDYGRHRDEDGQRVPASQDSAFSVYEGTGDQRSMKNLNFSFRMHARS